MIHIAPAIRPDSWLNEDRFADFRAAWGYAATQTHAIIAMSQLTPEQAYHLYEALKRGEERHCSKDV